MSSKTINYDLNVFFAIDENYMQHFTVAATSLLENNRDLAIQIFLIVELKKMELGEICSYFKTNYGIELQLIDVGLMDFSTFTTTLNYPKATYFRLLLAEIAPLSVQRALFLDSDLIVNGSLKLLAERNMKGFLIAAVPEASVKDNVSRLNAMGVPAKSYFNAGVLLADLESWRKIPLVEEFKQISTSHKERLQWVDQDILNIRFVNQWAVLERKYNATHLLEKMSVIPLIVHYASHSKPWFYIDTHPYNYLYWKYLKLTPFHKRRPVGFSFKNMFFKYGKLLKRTLRRVGLIGDYKAAI